MTKTDETNLHSVTVTVVDGEAKVAFTCAGTRTSACHVYPDTEEWSKDDGQERVEHDDCWLQDWFDVGPDVAIYAGEDAILVRGGEQHPMVARTGTISTEFDFDYITWEFDDIDAATAAAEKGSDHDDHA